MSFKDRLSRRVIDHPPKVTHVGRWIVRVDASASAVRVNRVVVESGQALMPGPTGEWEVAGSGHLEPDRGRFFADALPNDQDAKAIRELGRLLREKANDGWLAWSCTSPLAPGLDKSVQPHPFENKIELELEHLEAVCRRPRTHIHLEVEREVVARARRIARNAPQWLASHTEDWHHRTLTGVQPRRIRAEIREERWDLYENRVAARLVDNLVVWLRRRIAEVRRIRDDILAQMASFSGTTQGNRHRAERIYRLWGEAWEATDKQEMAKSTLARLERLLYKVLGLQDSPLYRHVHKQAHVSRDLRMTNLLSADDHYRGVARLWHQWSVLPTRGHVSVQEHYEEQQDLHDSFDAWCMLLVVRACSQLKLDPAADAEWESSLAKGRTVELDNAIRVKWEQAGGISIIGATGVLCRFVPLVQSLECARSDRALARRIAPIVEAVAETTHWTVVLHPAGPDPAPFRDIGTVGNPPHPGIKGALDFIRVSPFALDCVERVARAIRWATLVPQMLAYPACIAIPPEERFGAKPWLKERDGRWMMVVPPKDIRGEKRYIERRLQEARQHVEELERERDEMHRGGGAKRLLQKVNDAKKKVDAWSEFKKSVEKGIATVSGLNTCPRCGKPAEFLIRDKDCFAASCRSKSCGARWELRPSPDGESRVPVFHPDISDARQEQIDELTGCDILAVPASGDDGAEFLPPRRSPTTEPLERLLG